MVSYSWLVAFAALAAALIVAILFFTRRRVSAEEQERRRRLAVNASGRITDGIITDVHTTEAASGGVCHLLHYSYDLNGVTYSAAQDITALVARLDRDPGRIAGTASVKYLPDNPSNSIVICEEWSGLR